MKFTYITNGVCSRSIEIEIENGVLENVKYVGGCNGNLQGISALVKGLTVDEVIEKLQNIRCGFKSTSCPAQLAEALKQYKAGL
ncbi:MAG: TIGR03905 family TSCPD domain-containing protein [Ruminococcaceae bacterium]|nr:TIGR03905 family TSCPD domain-containing protein [Oscillospiraceae bacterium]